MKSCNAWGTYIGNYHVSVIRLPSGKYLGSMGEKPILDPFGTTSKQETFDTREGAFAYVGWPVGIVPLPEFTDRA